VTSATLRGWRQLVQVIFFLDSDDLWSKNKLEKHVKFMEENKIDFSYTNYSEIDEYEKLLNVNITGPKIINEMLMYLACWPGCLTVIYNQESLGKFSIDLIEKNNDYALWLKIIKKTKCYLLNENLGYYRKRNNSISSGKKLKLIKWTYILFRKNQKHTVLNSILLTLSNIVFTIFKKFFYVKRN
jgi:hypothetical protein